MRTVPPDLNFEPCPDDFVTPITDDGFILKASVMLNGASYELGFRPTRDSVSIAAAREDLRQGIWQLNEFARLDRPDLMAYASSQRHTARR